MAVEKEYHGVTYIISDAYLHSREKGVKRGDTRVIADVLLYADYIYGDSDIDTKSWYGKNKQTPEVHWQIYVNAFTSMHPTERDRILRYVKQKILGINL